MSDNTPQPPHGRAPGYFDGCQECRQNRLPALNTTPYSVRCGRCRSALTSITVQVLVWSGAPEGPDATPAGEPFVLGRGRHQLQGLLTPRRGDLYPGYSGPRTLCRRSPRKQGDASEMTRTSAISLRCESPMLRKPAVKARTWASSARRTIAAAERRLLLESALGQHD